MKKLIMTMDLLCVISMIQAAKNLYVNEVHLADMGFPVISDIPVTDWLGRVRRYVYDFDQAIFDNLGLSKNEFCIRAIIDFNITDEMKEASHDELHQFSFCY